MATVLLVRHGETTWNRSGRVQGWAPTPLTERGHEQAAALGAHLASTVDVDRLVSSDLRRAQETARYIARETESELTTDAASDMGLCSGTPLAIGMLDSAAELVGVGATEISVALVRLGTAGGVMTLTPRPAWRAGCMLYPHPVRPLWYYQAGTNAATTSLEWALSLFGIDTAGDAYALLDAEVASVAPGAEGMLFHPYLRGERAPYWSSRIRGGFSGVTIRHSRPAFLRSVLEGVAYSMRDCTSLLDWNSVTDIRVCGGGAKSTAWCQIMADVLALPVRQVTFQDASALGAALAAVAGCTDTDLAQLAHDAGLDSRLFEPERDNVATYEEGFRRYKEIAQQYLRTFS